ncbi:hypothetical protein EV675_3228 [Pigmentiphaga kullae]|uniref:Uncharacterized protein n=1 Tax=Pigmentiphaga kullae TaxID=151784 RepID=A0A4Q7NCC0_9BURK|nr:hypothetical protein EV675_3228 [Pigmentiphaga kullae]
MTLFVLAVGLLVGAGLGIIGTAMWFFLRWPQLEESNDE